MKFLLKTKWFYFLLLGFIFFLFQPQQANACDIEFEIIKNSKDNYQIGDTIVVKVKVTLTHRSCPVGLEETNFKMNGLKIIGATKWKQISTMEYERKLKLQVVGTKEGKVIINATRICDKDGGFGSLAINAAPIDE